MLDQILKCWAIEFGQNTELAVKHLLSRASRQFLDLLLRVARDPNDYTSICKKGLGNWLAAHRGEAAGGWRLESRTVNHQCAWRIVEAPFPQAPNLVDLLGYDRHVARQSGPEPLAPVSSGNDAQSRFHAIVESMGGRVRDLLAEPLDPRAAACLDCSRPSQAVRGAAFGPCRAARGRPGPQAQRACRLDRAVRADQLSQGRRKLVQARREKKPLRRDQGRNGGV
jgi:hypothetical protein